MGRNENRYALIAGKIDQKLPEGVPRQRIHTGGRLVEDQHLRFVNDGDGQGQALANAEGQIRSQLVEIILSGEIVRRAR